MDIGFKILQLAGGTMEKSKTADMAGRLEEAVKHQKHLISAAGAYMPDLQAGLSDSMKHLTTRVQSTFMVIDKHMSNLLEGGSFNKNNVISGVRFNMPAGPG